MARFAAERKTLRVVADQVGCPTYTLDLARAMTHMLSDAMESQRDLSGLYHFTNGGTCSWHGFALEIVAQMRRLDYPVAVEEVAAVTSAEFPQKAQRPQFSVLSKARFASTFSRRPRSWRAALEDYLKNHRAEIIES
jgi:dTDP-4-dehydrorhamnose reductase